MRNRYFQTTLCFVVFPLMAYVSLRWNLTGLALIGFYAAASMGLVENPFEE